MKQTRLDQLADGIFAILITLLAFELKIPKLSFPATNTELWLALEPLVPVFMSFVLSFAVLFTYWRAHHFIVSVYAKTIDVRLTSINAVFFFFVALIPFSSRFIADYPYTQIAISFYGINVIFIGLSLFWMRHHVLTSNSIEHNVPSAEELRRGAVRTLVPVFCSVIAIGLGFYNPTLSLGLFTFAIVFNLFSRTAKYINWIIERFTKERWEVVPTATVTKDN